MLYNLISLIKSQGLDYGCKVKYTIKTIYIYIQVHIHIGTYTYRYIYTQVHIHIGTYLHIHIGTYTYRYLHIHIGTYTYRYLYTCRYIYIQVHIHIQYIYIYIPNRPCHQHYTVVRQVFPFLQVTTFTLLQSLLCVDKIQSLQTTQIT